MRITRVTFALIAILSLTMLQNQAVLGGEISFDTNTKNEFPLLTGGEFNYESEINFENTEGFVSGEIVAIDQEREEKLVRWKQKQAAMWNNLPQGKFVVNASAYTAAADECGKSDGITASGVKVMENRTLACPANFPFGAKLNIEGYGVFVCEDRGGAIKGNKVDIYMETKAEAFKFGRRNLIAEVVQ